MTVDVNNDTATKAEQKISDKELNFRHLESKYERIINEERAEREKIARELDEIKRNKIATVDDDEDSEPYVDHKRLEKKLKSFEKNIDEKIDKKAEEKAHKMLEKREQENWLQDNPDFFDTVQGFAQKFFEKAPRLAEAILKMPDNFERKKLVYHNIKSLGLDQPEIKQSSIQEKVDMNRRSPYYQPSSVGTAPYSQVGDFSDAGKKKAYEQLQKLKANLRLGG